VIDIFSKESDAQIVHVTHDSAESGLSIVQPINTHAHHSKVFDELGARASDLLQSNCVIWVEGPSDRIYFNKWLELFDPDLNEHADYEFAFTGGAVLSHFSYDESSEKDMIEALKINRNAIVLMDKDKAVTLSGLKPHVERVSNEISGNDGLAWITEGKEVENYIPIEALRHFLGNLELEIPDPQGNMFELIKDNGKGDFSGRKVALAAKICGLLDSSMLAGCLDLKAKLTDVCNRIRKWNSQ